METRFKKLTASQKGNIYLKRQNKGSNKDDAAI